MASQVRSRRPNDHTNNLKTEVSLRATSPTTSTSFIYGKEVRKESSGCCGIFGLQGWVAGVCMMGGSGCMAASGYMPTLKGRVACGLAGLVSNLLGLAVGGRSYYVARLAKSIAESIVDLKKTERDLRGTVGDLQGEVQGFREAISGLQETRDGLDAEVGALREENQVLKESNVSLAHQIELGDINVEEQSRALVLGAEQLAINTQLIKNREAQSQSAGEALSHLEDLLEKAETGCIDKKAELDEVTEDLEGISADLEKQIESVRQAREELEERIPQLEQTAMERVQIEAEDFREKALADVTEQLAEMRVVERQAAILEAKEIRDEGAAEVLGLREAVEKERLLQEQGLQERRSLLTHAQGSIQKERKQMDAQRAVFVKREVELEALLAEARGNTTV